MRTARLHTGLFILVASVGFSPAWSDEVMLPASTDSGAAASASAPVTTPARGITMNKVEAQYGAPSERHSAVGTPPITRWDYPGFSVFFEHSHVIHSVVR